MCGLIGASLDHSSTLDLKVIQNGIQSLAHRGPDDRGTVTMSATGGSIVFGHTRLSIIDLTSGGHQPMASEDGRFTIIFNGEIYNYRELRNELKSYGYRFRTDSDTEVLLVSWIHWGRECIARLNGMFAFVIYDVEQQLLSFVRDAFGIKPLYYCVHNECIFFASEVPSLLEILPYKPELNLQSAYDYLVFGRYDDHEATFFEDVKHLMPGHFMEIDVREGTWRSQPKRWWNPSLEERSDLSFQEASEFLREKFLHNVQLHLRSDVPVGAALSGGVDSSAVVCAMRKVEPDMPIHTFTYVARDSDLDEEKWADRINEHTGAIAHKIVVTPDELAADLDDMIRFQGEPFRTTSIYAQYRVFRAARECGIKVTLEGQGADEMLAGYDGYPKARIQSLIDAREYAKLLEFLQKWPQWPGRDRKQMLSRFFSALMPETALPFSVENRILQWMGRNPHPEWLDTAVLAEAGVRQSRRPAVPSSGTKMGRRLVNALRLDLSSNKLNTLLRHGDRNAMRWSIESRVPFLTTDLAEYLLQLPEEFLISSGGETKHIFKHAMRGIVPDPVLDRRDKIGFQTPEVTWLRNLESELMGWIEGAEALPFLKEDQCRSMVSKFIEGDSGSVNQVWRLINYSRWAQMYYLP